MNWYDYLKETLRPDQLERIDAYDIQILASMYKRFRYLERIYVDVNIIRSDVHLEMGGLTAMEFDEHMRKLEDMALIRRQAVFNRDMPEDIE